MDMLKEFESAAAAPALGCQHFEIQLEMACDTDQLTPQRMIVFHGDPRRGVVQARNRTTSDFPLAVFELDGQWPFGSGNYMAQIWGGREGCVQLDCQLIGRELVRLLERVRRRAVLTLAHRAFFDAWQRQTIGRYDADEQSIAQTLELLCRVR